MFIEKTDLLAGSDLIEEGDRVFCNDHIPEGSFANAQFLRYDARKDEWLLEVRVQYTKIFVMLQEHQVKVLLDNTTGNVFVTKILDHKIVS